MSLGDPASDVRGSDSHPDDGDDDEEYEYEYEEVEEEIEVEEEVEVEDEDEFEEVEESEEKDDEDGNGDLIEDSADVIKIDDKNAEEGEDVEEELERDDNEDRNGNVIKDSSDVNRRYHQNVEEDEEEEWEEVDHEEQNGDLIKELTSLNDVDDHNEEVEEEAEEEAEHDVEEEVGAESEEEVEEEGQEEAESSEQEEEEEQEEVDMEIEAQNEDCDDSSINELINELTPVNQIDHKDTSQLLECHGHVDGSGLGAALQRNSVAEENADESYAGSYGIGDFFDPRQKGDTQSYGIVIPKDLGGVTSLDDNWRTSENNGVIDELNSGTSIIDAFSKAANSDMLCEKESNQRTKEEEEEEENEKQVVPRTRLRSLTPDEYSDGSKRQAVICVFFAKGWCIKGNLCKFLHEKDHAIVRQPGDEIIHVAEKKSELLDDEVSSIHNNSTSMKKSEMHKVSLDKDGCSMEIDKSCSKREDQSQYPPLPLERGSLFDETHSSGSLKSMEVSESGKYSSDKRNLEDVTCNREYVPDTQNSSASNTPSYKQPLPFGYSNGIITDVVSPQKLWKSYKENRVSRLSSLNRSSSPFFVGESDGPLKSKFLVDSQRLAELRSKMPYNWVPSVPFRPSFVVTQRLLSTFNLYNPVRDSIDQTGSDSIHEIKASKKADLPKLDCSSSKYPESGQTSHREFATELISGKDELVLDGEGMDTTDNNTGYILKEDKLLNTDKTSNHRERKGDGFEYIANTDKGAHRKEADANLKVDGSIFKESRVYKYFHATLVEFIKDLLRPAWHGGHLNKDAYKGIVKKVAEKVMCTLQPHQIPSTSESVEHYLSLSQSKLAKLVEGYVEKHRKS